MKLTEMERTLADAIYEEAKAFSFAVTDNATEDDIEESQGILYEFVKGMMVLLSDKMKLFVHHVYDVYAWEIAHYKRMETEEDIKHLF